MHVRRSDGSFPFANWSTVAVLLGAAAVLLAVSTPVAAAPIHTTYLWHMHQPIYWPDRSTWYGTPYEHAYETITLGHSQSDEFSTFNSDDRVHDYQDYPKAALQSVLDIPDAGAQVSFAGSLIQNVTSLGNAGWNGGRYAGNWWQPYRDAMAWTTSGGRRRLDPVVVAMHHSINPLVDEAVLRKMIQTQKAIMPQAWGSGALSTGFFPAEMCFSERMIPALAAEGVQWSIVPDVHIARASANYPYTANQDNCDPPNRADQINPTQPSYYVQTISRGVTTKVPAPFGFRPHYAQYVDPATGAITKIVVVPAANAMGWNEGYGLYGTGEIDAIAAQNDPAKPMLILFAHDDDNAWAGGFSYFNDNVTQFCHAAASHGYEPTTIAEYLADHPVDAADVVHVEDGGWVNADGDFGSPQFINWNWPLVNASGQFDIPNGWAEDERNWAVLTAATNRVLTAEQVSGVAPNAARIVDPTQAGTTAVEKAWHYLLAGHESGYMYYGTALDFEIKPSMAANRAVEYADPVALSGADLTAPTIWLPQRLPWNPGGKGGGSLWGYPGGAGATMTQDFWVWTFAYDVSGVDSVMLKYRIDGDGSNPQASIQNETYTGGAEVGAWQTTGMTRRTFPAGNVYNNPSINFSVLPQYIAEQFSAHVSGLTNVLIDYYVEARDEQGNVRKSPIQHVYVGATGSSGPSCGVACWTPANPVPGGTLTISYDPVAGTLPDNTNPVYIHIGHSGWTNIIDPDPVMTFNPDSARWYYAYDIPCGATAVDFVFNNGAGTWDNNSGADWHVAVSGATVPFVMDGTLDTGVPIVASCGGRDLRAKYDGRWLYMAAPPVSATTNLDHFLLVAHPLSVGTRAAMWAKAGTCAIWDYFVGSENDNTFVGWFDGAENLFTSASFLKASGSVLEAAVDLQCAFGTAPNSVRVAFAGYGTPNAGALQIQAPCGDADGDLEAAEWITLDSPLISVDGAPIAATGIRMMSSNPSRGEIHAVVDLGASDRVVVDLVDVAGRVVQQMYNGATAGALAVNARLGATGPIRAGVYFLRATGAGRTAARRVVLMP